MALVPATPGDFRSREYWDTLFGSKQPNSLEWYGTYEDFALILESCLRRASEAALQTSQSTANCATDPASTLQTTGHTHITEQRLLQQAKTTIENAPFSTDAPDCNCNSDQRNRSSYRILCVGCGDSELSERLTTNGRERDGGFKVYVCSRLCRAHSLRKAHWYRVHEKRTVVIFCENVTANSKSLHIDRYGIVVNVDFSPVVIERMKWKYRHEPRLLWECLDVRGGSLVRRFGEEAFDAVVDKGFLDALLSTDLKEQQPRGTEPGAEVAARETLGSAIKKGGGAKGSEGLSRHGHQQDAAESPTAGQEDICKEPTEKNNSSSHRSLYSAEAKDYLLSALKVLKPGGVFIIISLAQDYIVKEIVRSLYAAQVEVTIHPLPLTVSRKMAAKMGMKAQTLLPFIFCVEKKRGRMLAPDLLSYSASNEDLTKLKTASSLVPTKCIMKPELGRATCDDVFVIWALPKKIQEVFRWRRLQSALCAPNPGSRSIVLIHSSGIQSIESRADDSPRYVVTIYDVANSQVSKNEKTFNRATAAILTAPGEERCWLFATPEGNEELATQAGARRILIVTRGSETPRGDGNLVEGVCESTVESDVDVDHVSKELGPYLADLALADSGKIPLMMVRNASTRVIAEVARERSESAGWITVRDLELSDDEDASILPPSGGSKGKQNTMVKSKRKTHDFKVSKQEKGRPKALRRQMIFYCNPHTVQSEVKLTMSACSGGNGGPHHAAPFAFLQPVCGYHIPIAAAFALIREARERKDFSEDDAVDRPRIRAAVLGLGGGVLSMFLHLLFGDPLDLELTCVDNDPIVVNLAYKYFGFRECPRRLRCVLEDAHEYLKRLASKSLHAIIIDINSGSSEVAMRCPTEDFVDKTILMKMKDVLVPGGLLIFNLLCRCLKIKNEVFERLSGMFPSVSSISLREDANEVVVCQVDGPLVELPGHRGVVERHLRKLVRALGGMERESTRDREEITKCAVQILNCGREWRVHACRNASNSLRSS